MHDQARTPRTRNVAAEVLKQVDVADVHEAFADEERNGLDVAGHWRNVEEANTQRDGLGSGVRHEQAADSGGPHARSHYDRFDFGFFARDQEGGQADSRAIHDGEPNTVVPRASQVVIELAARIVAADCGVLVDKAMPFNKLRPKRPASAQVAGPIRPNLNLHGHMVVDGIRFPATEFAGWRFAGVTR